MAYMQPRQGSILAGAGWMVLLSILLFWLPIVGPLIAGFIGGRVAGSAGNGFVAAILPAIIIGLIVFGIATFFGLPFIGVIVGTTLFILIIFHSVWVIIGGIIGGALA